MKLRTPPRSRKIPGVGRKTAERLLVEMRDRLDALERRGRRRRAGAERRARSAEGEAWSALVALGYKPAEVTRMLKPLRGPARHHRRTDPPRVAGHGAAAMTDRESSTERIVQAAGSHEEEAVDRAIRPKRLADYIGQEPVKAQLEIFIKAARQRGEALDHVLIFGPPGLGKTTLAHIIANELGVNLRQTSGPVLERPGDLAALLTNLQPRDVLFIDEIHRLSPGGRGSALSGDGGLPARHHDRRRARPRARSSSTLPPFTLVGATTRAGLLTSPLRDRFGIVQRLEFYTRGRARRRS